MLIAALRSGQVAKSWRPPHYGFPATRKIAVFEDMALFEINRLRSYLRVYTAKVTCYKATLAPQKCS